MSAFALAWFSSLSSERLCIFDLRGAMYIKIFLVTSFSLPFSELSLVELVLDQSCLEDRELNQARLALDLVD